MTATPRDELRPTAQGELARARECVAVLAALLEGVARSADDATRSSDPKIVADRLRTVVLSGAAVLDELGGVATSLGG